MFSVRLAALALPLAAIPAFAQTSLPAVVVSASRTQQRLQDALPATTLITREEIERAAAPDLPTLLRRVAGVEIAQNGGPGTVASAFIRGADSRHTLVLVDGVPVNNLNFGTAALEHLPLADVERIEIVRGNVSSLYGSAALGGVIQIFTREAGLVPQGSVAAQVGSRGLARLTASGATRLESGTRLRASVESLSDKGFNTINQAERPGTNPDRDGYSRRSASFGVTQELAGGHSVGLRLRDARGKTAYDSQFGPATQADESRFAESGAVLEGRFRLSGNVDLNAALTSSSDKLDASVTAFPFRVDSFSKGAQLAADWTLAPGQHVTAGAEGTRQRIESDTVYDRASRTLTSLRLGYSADTGPHQLQVNVRNDRYSDFGSASTWYAGYAYRLSDAWRVNATASTGFNAPTFNDLYFPFGGNASLRPERLKSAELGVQYAVGAHLTRAVLFDNRFTDLIGNDADFNRVNIGRARNRGVDLSYSGRIGDVGVRAGLVRQNPTDRDTGARLARRAGQQATLGADYGLGAWRFGGSLLHVGSRFDDAANKRPLAAYTTADLYANWQFARDLGVQANVNNVGNKQYETAYGYNQPRRGVYLTLRWQPK
ncbi:MAG: TonB-dependent receptor [Ramlibacter sp.]|nr:TonB-dependent receptor [Ramlibacter sp.]